MLPEFYSQSLLEKKFHPVGLGGWFTLYHNVFGSLYMKLVDPTRSNVRRFATRSCAQQVKTVSAEEGIGELFASC